MTGSTTTSHRGRRRFLPLVWAASAVSAAVLVLGVNGTLSAWTSAVITNSNNTVATANAVILKEVGPDGTSAHASQTCYSSDGAGNSYTCANINKFGGAGTGVTPMSPGDTRNIDVVFTNAGLQNAGTFKLAPDPCSQTPTANAAVTPAVNNLCTATNELTVAVSCVDGGSYPATNPATWTDLKYTAGTVAGLNTATAASLTHTGTATSLNAGSSWTCRFTVALNANASVTDQGITVSQLLKWTLAQ